MPQLAGTSWPVSIHAPVRGATSLELFTGLFFQFQSTPPCGGRPPAGTTYRPISVFQSTPPCGGRHDTLTTEQKYDPVSIHAPVRGATSWEDYIAFHGHVSIHAPVRGATRSAVETGDGRGSFNPRPRAGGDKGIILYIADCLPVSIHAPVRGATFIPWDYRGGKRCFNPRPRAGGDQCLICMTLRTCLFQSTPPCGGRQGIILYIADCLPVSIHAPVRGATLDWKPITPLTGVSIHAPVRGATCHIYNKLRPSLPFQSTPPCGGRLKPSTNHQSRESVSIHAPVRGATFLGTQADNMIDMFQSTPPCGGRPPFPYRRSQVPFRFNPRPRAGGDLRSLALGKHF